jgi:hypothetical protein
LAQIFALGSRWDRHIRTLIKPRSRKPTHWSAGLRYGPML